MPIYEFKCKNCGNIDEKYFKSDTADLVLSGKLVFLCKRCGGSTKRIISISSYKMSGYNEANGYS